MSGSPQRRSTTPKIADDGVKADAALPFPGARPPSPHRGGARRSSLKYDQLIIVANSALDDEDLEIGLKVFMAGEMGDISRLESYLPQLGGEILKLRREGQLLTHVAATRGNLELVNWLLAKMLFYRAPAALFLNAANSRGETALARAACYGHVAVVEALLAAGADPNRCNSNGESPLYLAAGRGYLALVEALLRCPRTDASVSNMNGMSAVDIASIQERLDIADLIHVHFYWPQVRLLLLASKKKPMAGQTSVWAGLPLSLVKRICQLAYVRPSMKRRQLLSKSKSLLVH